MIRKSIILLWLISFSSVLWQVKAQDTTVFSSDPALFLNELEAFFTKAPERQRKVAAELAGSFRQGFTERLIAPEIQQSIIESANVFVLCKLNSFPNLYAYFSALQAYFMKETVPQQVLSWNRIVEKYIHRGDNDKLIDYLEKSRLFFEQGLVFRSPNVMWRIAEARWNVHDDSIPGFAIRNGILQCYASRDSLSIYDASGIYVPESSQWIGNTGLVKWERTLFAPEAVFTSLNLYKINLANTSFYADSVWLQFPPFFKNPVHGRLKHSIAPAVNQESAIYPQFTSYSDMLPMNNLFRGIDYLGGISLEGSRIIGFGTIKNNARLVLKKDGNPVVELLSDNFMIQSDRIISARASFCLRYGDDSITHPGLQMRYFDPGRELTLLRLGDGIPQCSFYDSFHNLDMYFESVSWNLDNREMIFGAMRSLSRGSEAVFESASFFSPQRFYNIQGPDVRHPLLLVNDFVNKQHSGIFYPEEFADYVNLSLDQVNAMLLSLANQGFLDYDPVTGKAVAKSRIKYYIDAINEQTDYDVVRFESKVDGNENARLDLNTFDLKIYGVPQVKLSNPQKVLVYPGNKSITVKKGLDFIFQGSIFAGYFEFYVGESNFVYKEFKINLPQIDSLAFNVPLPEKDQLVGLQRMQKVKTIIKNISGELMIDAPGNKSGTKNLAAYPIFESENDSYVFFDQPDIQNGVYQRDSFYYHILPFQIDSLNDFTTVGMSFNGSLYSGNIFPLIEEPLRVQPDFSLGFTKPDKGEGLPLYGGKATAVIQLTLDQRGLLGSGTIKYLESVSKSENFIFHPDSMMARVREFNLRETLAEIYYPAVTANEINQTWIHGGDKMILESTQNVPFSIYNNQLIHHGILILRSTGLFGAGEITYANAVFTSKDFGFHNHVFSADNCTFAINNRDKRQVFTAQSYGFDFDLLDRQGTFSAKDTPSRVEFPENKYIAFIDAFRWDVNSDVIHISNENSFPGYFKPGPDLMDQVDSDTFPLSFVSAHPGQDSLRFAAAAAKFNLKESNLQVTGVPFIELADAVIFTADGEVSIMKNAEMMQLTGAYLITGKTNRYHSLYNVAANISGKKNYTASGVYDYYDEFDKVQNLFFNHIAPDTAGITMGRATIAEIPFQLNPFFDFRGDIFFYADRKAFYFDGGFRIRHECPDPLPRWVKFSGEVEKNNVVLPLSKPLTGIDGKTLESSIFFSQSNNKVYAGFLREKQQFSDHPFFSAAGNITFDPLQRSYLITSNNIQGTSDQIPSFLKFNVDSCLVSADGILDFGMNTGLVKMFTSGSIEHYILLDSTMFRLFMAVDFFFNTNALDHVNKIVEKTVLPGMNPDNPLFNNGLGQLLSESDAQRVLNELNLYGTFRRFPRELSYTMILSDVQLKWNSATRSFTSIGPIGIATFNNQLVNRYVDGYIEFIKRRTGDVVTIYLQPAANEWYFFSYTTGIMQAISSNESFNTILLELPEKRRRLKVSDNNQSYEFIISTLQQRNAFLRKVRGN